MQCQTCNYELWNLSQPHCPECGTGFDLRDYRFTPGTVAFACPHCQHLHGGLGDSYLPSTDDQAQCLNCNAVMTVTDMSVIPMGDGPIHAEFGRYEPAPWIKRKQIGFWRAWWQTCVMALFDPQQLGKRIPQTHGFGDAYKFTTLTIFLSMVSTAVVGLVLVLLANSGMNQGPTAVQHWNQQVFAQLIQPFFSVLIPLFIVAIYAGPAHLLLRITGGCRKTFQTTANSFLYGQGTMIIGIIPLSTCSSGVGSIWALVSTILILTASQRISGLRATMAVLLPLILLFMCCLGSAAAMIAYVFP